jgi:hypothetical protein
MATDLFQLILAPDALQKVSSTPWVLSKFAYSPLRYRVVSSANVWSLILPPLSRVRPSMAYLGFSNMCPRTSVGC